MFNVFFPSFSFAIFRFFPVLNVSTSSPSHANIRWRRPPRRPRRPRGPVRHRRSNPSGKSTRSEDPRAADSARGGLTGEFGFEGSVFCFFCGLWLHLFVVGLWLLLFFVCFWLVFFCRFLVVLFFWFMDGVWLKDLWKMVEHGGASSFKIRRLVKIVFLSRLSVQWGRGTLVKCGSVWICVGLSSGKPWFWTTTPNSNRGHIPGSTSLDFSLLICVFVATTWSISSLVGTTKLNKAIVYHATTRFNTSLILPKWASKAQAQAIFHKKQKKKSTRVHHRIFHQSITWLWVKKKTQPGTTGFCLFFPFTEPSFFRGYLVNFDPIATWNIQQRVVQGNEVCHLLLSKDCDGHRRGLRRSSWWRASRAAPDLLVIQGKRPREAKNHKEHKNTKAKHKITDKQQHKQLLFIKMTLWKNGKAEETQRPKNNQNKEQTIQIAHINNISTEKKQTPTNQRNKSKNYI